MEDYRQQGVEAQESGDLDQALGYFFKAISVDPTHHVVLNDIGVIYEKMGELDLAEEHYLASIKSNPDYLPPYANLGYLYKKKQNFVKAIEYFQKRVEFGDPKDPWTAKAQEELYKVHDLNPYLKQRMIEGTAEKFNKDLSTKILKKQVKQANNKYRRGQKFFRRGKYKEAYEQFDNALKLTPGNPKIVKARNQALLEYKRQRINDQIDLTQELLEENKPYKAEKEFQKILTIVPNASQ